jgi:hypothetical protein
MGIAHSVVLWSEEALQTPDLEELLVTMTLGSLSGLDLPA